MSTNNKFLTLLSGIKTLVNAISSSTGVTDANKIVSTGDTGKIDASLLPQNAGLILSGSVGFRLFEDFLFGVGSFSSYTTGTGASCSPVNTGTKDLGNHPGICQLSTGTSNNSVIKLGGTNGDNLDRVLLGYATWEIEMLVQVAILRNATDDFQVDAGFFDNPLIASIVDGLFFMYSSNSIYWQIRNSSNSVVTTYTTAVEVIAGNWYKLRLKVNANADNVDYFINDTYITSITTNIPKGSNRQTQPGLAMNKIAGTSNRQFFIDYFDLVCLLTSAR